MSINPAHTGHDAGRALCWSCHKITEAGPFCTHCVKIQPAEELGDYFTLFGLPRKYKIRPGELKKIFFDLSRKFHPDYYSGRPEKEKNLARDNTAYLNTALNVLLDPIRRGEYLLSLETGNFSSRPAPPQDLFEEILEIGEILDRQDLSETDMEKLKRAADSFHTRFQAIIESMRDLFNRLLDGDKSVKGDIESSLNSLKYLRKISSRIASRLSEGGHI